MRTLSARVALVLVSLALLAPSYAAAADGEDVAELQRMVRELLAQNRELSRRLGALESEREAPAAPQTKPAKAQERHTPAPSAAEPSTTVVASPPAAPPPPEPYETTLLPESYDTTLLPEPYDTTELGLEERVRELEVGQAAQEHATRQIIRDTLVKTGPKINSFIELSGAVEVVAARFQDFTGPTMDALALSTAELDFDIKLSDWLAGSLVLGFEDSSTTFPTTTVSSVDRFTLDRTNIRVGDFTQFPIAARVGREALPFGTSTGVARLDTLSLGTPLTTEVFENRQTVAGLEFAWPTPPLQPPPAPVVIPPVQPQVIAPLVGKLARWLGYRPLPQRVPPLEPITPPVDPPPFYGSFFFYKGSENFPDQFEIEDFNASLGYRTNGHCGRPYEELQSSLVCPWQIDVHVDYNSSVFDSIFLEQEYRPFLGEIGRVPGIAASAKASFGPFALVGEFTSAIDEVSFLDGLLIPRNITPMAWQVSLGYQFDWNPWITEIGAQGDFISVAYSGSEDMAGVIDVDPTTLVATRVGFVPQHRLLVTAGEWVLDGLKVALEYSANWDYPVSSGGTGELAHGVLGSVELNF